MRSVKKVRLGAKMHRAIASVFHIQPQSATVDYASWRRNFMRSRLKLGLWLALISFLTFTLLELSNLIFNREAFQVTWLRSQIAVEFSLALCLLLMHSRLGHRRPGLILLGFSWSVMLIPLHVRAVLTQALEPDLIVWYAGIIWSSHPSSGLLVVTSDFSVGFGWLFCGVKPSTRVSHSNVCGLADSVPF
uniref:Uncharacterized protein n=1 Tax=Desertifilum tharense IPPAS B-1220 TaxID=1781255 RepID=A0ACD5GY28_9CYAN